jgi:hypothetical protein
MFSRTKTPLETLLVLENERVIRRLKDHVIGSKEYAETLELSIKLHKMKNEEKNPSVSKDTLAVVGANLLGIFMIIKHENLNVIASRAMNLVMKPR